MIITFCAHASNFSIRCTTALVHEMEKFSLKLLILIQIIFNSQQAFCFKCKLYKKAKAPDAV